MPCSQYDALDRRQQAWHDQGIDSDESTIQDEAEDQDDDNDPREYAAPLEARIHMTTIDMFK